MRYLALILSVILVLSSILPFMSLERHVRTVVFGDDPQHIERAAHSDAPLTINQSHAKSLGEMSHEAC